MSRRRFHRRISKQFVPSSTAAARIIRLELLVDKQAAALAAGNAQLVKLQIRSRSLSRDVQPGLRELEQKLEQQSAVLRKLADSTDQSNQDANQLREQLAALQGAVAKQFELVLRALKAGEAVATAPKSAAQKAVRQG
ncbi:hypothetical protein WJX74_009392 [Apatococcus lobatus]|uniref:Uncharacterized protein n=1 Tax=Apatococcus lobatus TaxID=904363 RepID=A0AAW1RJM5_9CHLO